MRARNRPVKSAKAQKTRAEGPCAVPFGGTLQNQRKSPPESVQGGLGSGLGVLVGGMLRRAEAPTDKVASVESDAEEIRGDEAELCGAHANDAHDRAVHRSNDPA